MTYKESIQNYLTIEYLYNNGEIGVRSYNALLNEGIYTIQDIVKYYNKSKTFDNIKNIGELSNRELLAVVEKYEIKTVDFPFALLELQEKFFKEFVYFLHWFFPNKKIWEIVDINERSGYNEIVKKLLEKEAEIRQSRNEEVILSYYSLMHYFVNFVTSLGEATDKWSYLLIFVQAGYHVAGLDYRIVTLDNIYNPFKLLFETMINSSFFEEREKIIIRNCYNLEEDKHKRGDYENCLRRLSRQLNRSSERVRQLRDDLYAKFLEYLRLGFLVKDVIKEKYGIDYESTFIAIVRTLAERIRKEEDINLSHVFYELVMYGITRDTHDLIGVVRYILFQHNVYFKNNSFYCIKKEYSEIFDFNSFIEKVTLRYKTAIKDDEAYDLKEYVKEFFKRSNVSETIKNEIFDYIKIIVENDFDVEVKSGKLIFKRTSKETLNKLVYRVLDMHKHPMTINEIYEELKNMREKISKDSIRSTVVTDKVNFVSFGRNSTYALRKHIDNKSVKAGTIRSITQELLEKYDHPISVDKVVEYVQKYRKASRSSILSNLKLDSSHVFIFYKDKTMGLTSKPYYKSDDTNAIQTRWERNLEELKEYIKLKGQYPEFNINDKDEFRLYKFCRLNAILYNRNKIHPYCLVKLQEINFDFDMKKWPFFKEMKKNKK